MKVYADLVLNHNNGADRQELTRSSTRNAGRALLRKATFSPATGPASIPPLTGKIARRYHGKSCEK
jgi:hypothetical protein